MRVLVTGATDGIGEEIARQMAGRGARVVVHGRSAEKAEAAAERMGAAEIAVADLASFAQVRAMADGLSGSLDGLVNNAGIGYGTAPPRNARTEDGHEPTWQVNFLSAFLLTELLRERLRGGRVVHVSSGVHSSGSVDLERPDEPRYATPYAQSKIALVMLAREQGERWARDGRQRLQPRLDRHEDGRRGRRRPRRWRGHARLDAHGSLARGRHRALLLAAPRGGAQPADERRDGPSAARRARARRDGSIAHALRGQSTPRCFRGCAAPGRCGARRRCRPPRRSTRRSAAGPRGSGARRR